MSFNSLRLLLSILLSELLLVLLWQKNPLIVSYLFSQRLLVYRGCKLTMIIIISK
jgi:hypothetical protein